MSLMGATCSACATGYSLLAGAAVAVRVSCPWPAFRDRMTVFNLETNCFGQMSCPGLPSCQQPASLQWWFPASGMPSSRVRSSTQAGSGSVSGFRTCSLTRETTVPRAKRVTWCVTERNPDTGQLNG